LATIAVSPWSAPSLSVARVAFEPRWGNHKLMVGTFGMAPVIRVAGNHRKAMASLVDTLSDCRRRMG
jgi:hypothetical protein